MRFYAEIRSWKWLLLPLLCGAIPSSTSAAIIADLTGDFTPISFPAGWSYLRNTAVIGNATDYTPLLWDAGQSAYDVTGSGFPAPGPNFTNIRPGGVSHPGRGTAQGDAFNGYLILAYTIQPGEQGLVTLVNGSIRGNNPSGAGGASNGWDLRFYIGNSQQGSSLIVPWSSASAQFSQTFGQLGVGETIYVALGPNGSFLFDGTVLGFQLDSTPVPEPQTGYLIAFGLLAAGASRNKAAGALRWRKKVSEIAG